MHIPDGFLNPSTTLTTLAASGAVLTYSLRELKQGLNSHQIPLMGLLASFAFLLQLFSFPVVGGTSIHLSGVLLITLLLGPWAAFAVLSVSLLALALLFQHGGLFSLGANVLNIAGVGCFLSHVIYRNISNQRIAIILAGLGTGLASAFLCAGELAFSDIFDFATGLKSMTVIYTITGLIEGFVTILIVDFIRKVKPSILELSG